ncbi:MAG: YidC/Oxa1 family insertase periplasmic-domain containing protein, partial [Elusimicrobiota bacterium]
MERNLILAVALSICVYVGWFALMDRYYPKPPAQAVKSASVPARAPAAQQVASLSAGAGQPRSAARTPEAEEESWEFRSGGLGISVRADGAALAGFRYPGPLGRVELIAHPEPGFLCTLPELRFAPDPDTERAASGAVSPEAGPLVFRAKHPNGLLIRKEFRFDDRTLLHSLRLTFSNPLKGPVELPEWELSLGPGLGTVASEQKENSSQWRALALMPPAAGRTQDRIETFKVKEEPLAHEKPWKWLAVENRYFLAAVFPPEDRFSGYRTGAAKVGKEASLAPWLKAQALPSRLTPGAALTLDIPFYLGPKSYTAMQGLGLGLERSVDFGWFTRLGRFALRGSGRRTARRG